MLSHIRRLVRRLRLLVRRKEHEQAMTDEMRFHLEMEAAELRRAGTSREDAERRARLAFGSVEQHKEAGRDARGTRLVEDLWQDLGYAVRQLRASPGFAAATVLTLALGIGVTTTMQSFRWYTTSQERAVAAPERLVALGQGRLECMRCARLAAGNYLTIRDRVRTLEHVSMLTGWDPVLRGADGAELLDGVRVTTGFFQTFAMRSLIGRTLVPDDSLPDRRQVVVLSERMWRTRFEADTSVIGRTIVLDRTPYLVVGVLANAVLYPRNADFWTPLVLPQTASAERSPPQYRAYGRLRDGATLPMLSAELAVVAGQLSAALPVMMTDSVLTATSFAALGRPDGDAQTIIVRSAVWLVLLIACVNLAGLLIARLSARRLELGVRRALGAGPGRLVRQLLVETILLTLIGGACGALIAVWGLGGLVGWSEVRFDLRVFAVALGMGCLSGVVIGVGPAVRFARPMVVRELRERAGTGSVDAARGRRALTVVQVALAIVLLSAAGLLARSFQRMYSFAAGFSADRLLTVRLLAPEGAERDPDQIDRLVDVVRTVPGVVQAGATLGVPFGHGWSGGGFDIDGRSAAAENRRPRARLQATTPAYFAALGIPVLRGRDFSDADRANAPRVAIINATLAERFFPQADPLGRALVIDSARWEIVGVVGTVFTGDFDELAVPEIYRPMRQWPRRSVWIAARMSGEPAQMGSAVATALRRVDPDLAVTRLSTMNDLRYDDMGAERSMLRLMAAFALAAVLICAIGLYGLISYNVAQRTREFGVRLALGADRGAVLRLVLAQGLRPAAIGAAFGIAGAIGVTRVMQSLLFRVSPTDPLTLGTVAAVTAGMALLAAWTPARRAMRVDPMTSLREE